MDHEIFDTQNIEEQERIEFEFDYLAAELKAYISRYEQRYKTEIYNVVFIGSRASRFGALGGGGSTVGREAGSVDLNDIIFDYDRIAFYITADNKLLLKTADHDGTNYMKLVLVTEREQQQADEMSEDIRAYIDDKAKRSSRLDNKFLAAFGCLR